MSIEAWFMDGPLNGEIYQLDQFLPVYFHPLYMSLSSSVMPTMENIPTQPECVPVVEYVPFGRMTMGKVHYRMNAAGREVWEIHLTEKS